MVQALTPFLGLTFPPTTHILVASLLSPILIHLYCFLPLVFYFWHTLLHFSYTFSKSSFILLSGHSLSSLHVCFALLITHPPNRSTSLVFCFWLTPSYSLTQYPRSNNLMSTLFHSFNHSTLSCQCCFTPTKTLTHIFVTLSHINLPYPPLCVVYVNTDTWYRGDKKYW